MARPTNASRLDRAAEEAEDLIRSSLVELTAAALKSALTPAEVTCAHCKRKFPLEGTSADTGLILKLLERVAGKATEKKETGVSGTLEKLLESLAGGTATTGLTPAQAAEAARQKARNRAVIAATLKEAAVTP